MSVLGTASGADCFVHASDLHLDAPLGSLGRLDRERSAGLRALADKAWDNLVELCIREQASFLVLAGDVFDKATAGVGVQSRLRVGLRRLAESGVEVFICHGNHDPNSDGFKPIGGMPDGVVRFAAGAPQSHVVTLRHSRDPVRVSGVSFGQQQEKDNLALRFRDLKPDPTLSGVPHVAVLHANVGGNPGHDPYAPCSYADLDRGGVDYWALGHIHQRHVRRLPGGTQAAYCGNLQGRSFKPSECEPKGALVVPVEHGRIGEPRFEPCDEVRFVRQQVVLHRDSIGEAQDQILECALEVGAEHAPRPVALEVSLTGTSEDALQLAEAADNGELYDAMSDEFVERLGGGGLCGVDPSVRVPGDRDAIMAGTDLRAEVLRDLQRLRPTSTRAEPGAGTADGDTAGTDARARLEELLEEGLPQTLRKAWREVLREQPVRIEDVVTRAELLLLDAFAESGDGTP